MPREGGRILNRHRYRACADWMFERYGETLQRIPLDLATGCPRGVGGRCSFCAEDGARAQQLGDARALDAQVERARAFAIRRYRAGKFMVYFQAHTPLWRADEARWQAMGRCLQAPGVVSVSVGARPDDLSDEALARLSAWRQRMDVWVELGVQTANDRTLARIRRGHDWACAEEAIDRLHRHGFLVAVHLILGLPGEGAADIVHTAEQLGRLPVDGLKLHQLQVLSGSELATQYAEKPFPTLSPSAYADHVIAVLRRISCRTVIWRVSADAPEARLLAPVWHSGKGAFLTYLDEEMALRNVVQGDLHAEGGLSVGSAPSPIQFSATRDGSTTFLSEGFKAYGHAEVGARLEARGKYVIPGQLKRRLQSGPVKILDIGFGLGANSREALECAAELKQGVLNIDAVERDRTVVSSAVDHVRGHDADHLNWREVLSALVQQGYWENETCRLSLGVRDARSFVRHCLSDAYDLIFLDAFSPPRCPQLWSLDFFKLLFPLLKPRGALLTYCAAGAVRAGLLQAGFLIGNTPPVGRDQPGTIAVKDRSLIEHPLTAVAYKLITRGAAAVPYRDPDLIEGRKGIQRRRQRTLEAWHAGA